MTRLLRAAESEQVALGELVTLLYDQLWGMAQRALAREQGARTLQPTALVHEVWMRLAGEERPPVQSRRLFFSAAAEAMRRILIEEARRRGRQKRGGGKRPVTFEDLAVSCEVAAVDVLALDEALGELDEKDAHLAQVVRLKFFSGHTSEEVGELLDVSPSRVKRDWSYARLWLQARMERGGDG